MKESKQEETYLTTIPSVFAWLCCLLDLRTCLFSPCYWLFNKEQWFLDHLSLSDVFSHSPFSLCAAYPQLAQLWPLQCKQIICPLFLQIISQYVISTHFARQAGGEQMHQEGGRIAAGDKNAYSSLWLVQRLAAGGLGLGLGQGPGPELAQLLAAVYSLPQSQPHCAKLLHTYNLLIIYKVFKEFRKKSIAVEWAGGKLMQTELPFSEE